MRKDLRHITIEKSVPDDEKSEEKNVLTVEGIRLKSTYSKQDTESLEHLDFAAGFPPNLRGIHSTMYVQKPWKTQKVKEFTINSLENMKAEINSFSVNETTVFKTVIDTILPIIAFYIIPTETKNVQTEKITGIVQNEILKEILTPELHRTSLKIITDILEFTGKKALFDSVCISGCAIQKAGASVDMELAYTLAHGFEIIRTGLSAGMKIDDIASRLSFSFGTGMNHFMEIAKMRAARMIWAKLIQQFNPKDSKSLHLQIHAQTTHHHINTENLLNTITRICIASATAAYGGTQSLQTGFSDTNDNFSGNISEKFIETTQSYFQNETKITKTVDRSLITTLLKVVLPVFVTVKE